ncbi:hypothetical protein J8Z82_09940 [Yersinia enterocolitica]|uniref:hypothetical protein n=1 Tax=Yersinia enterocolitica TaxID=630 RepID=UPI001C8E4509|nr:hypothetical protein [Yersinia enterocolitica]MBX9489521.1 hypothetical protein [Yersinia enterocolitica]MBX9492111.1 hypothetical protein [Yersinia enterocolitica]
MQLYAILFTVVVVCITVFYCFSKGGSLSGCNVDAWGLKAEHIELVIPANDSGKHTMTCTGNTAKRTHKSR